MAQWTCNMARWERYKSASTKVLLHLIFDHIWMFLTTFMLLWYNESVTKVFLHLYFIIYGCF